jgi:hypothetical protein
LAHVDNPKRPIRTKLGQLLMVGSMPLAVGIAALSKAPDSALWVVGVMAGVGLAFMFGESSE